jgi:hypothetical protein
LCTHFQNHSRNRTTQKRPPQHLARKIRANLLITKQHASNRRTKRHTQPARARRAKQLAHLAPVVAVLGEQAADEVADACGDVHEGAETHAGADGEDGAEGFDEEDVQGEEGGDAEA